MGFLPRQHAPLDTGRVRLVLVVPDEPKYSFYSAEVQAFFIYLQKGFKAVVVRLLGAKDPFIGLEPLAFQNR